jgi:type IV pilus assembly protein PilN
MISRALLEPCFKKEDVTVRLNINLATKPYQDVRRVLLQWGGLVLLLAVATVALLWMAVSSWRESRDVNAKIAVVNSEIAALDRQRAEALTLVKLPQNSSVMEDSKFLNGLIARKSFSWTRVFMQLEQIMPPKLHVVSISPELQTATNTVEVHLTVAGTSREAAVELVKRLEQSSSFRDARITEESAEQERDSADTVQFHVTAVYVPQATPAAQTQVAATKAAPNAAPNPAPQAATNTASQVAESKGGSR